MNRTGAFLSVIEWPRTLRYISWTRNWKGLFRTMAVQAKKQWYTTTLTAHISMAIPAATAVIPFPHPGRCVRLAKRNGWTAKKMCNTAKRSQQWLLFLFVSFFSKLYISGKYRGKEKNLPT